MPALPFRVELVMSEPTSSETPATPSLKPLTGKQAQHLRGLAHGLSPVVHVGKEGLTDAVTAAVNTAIDTHELIKVKLPQIDKTERRAMTQALAAAISCQVAGELGRIAILYRRHREKPVIKLPR
jgi:RNA-binding protein